LLRYVDNNTINYNDPSGFGKFSALDTEVYRSGGGGFGSGGYNNIVPFNRGGNISPGGTSTGGAITPAYRPSVTTTPSQPFRPLPYGPVPNNIPDDLPVRRSPVPTAPEPYGPPEPFGPPAPYRPPSEREVQRMLDKRFQDIQRNNPKHQDPKRVVITKTIVVTEEQLEAERTESPDPNCPEAKRREECKKQGRRILYRGDSRSPNDDNIFFDGFKVDPENTMDNLERHVNENPTNTIFISTSEKESVGIDSAINRGKQNGYLYEICDPGNGRNAQVVYNMKKYNGRHKFKDQAEIAFAYEIPGRYIIKSTYYNSSRKPGSSVLNPSYNPYPYIYTP
jgi:hypothetical protein